MKKKDIQALHDHSVEKLRELLIKAQAELVKLEADLGAGRVKNVHQVKTKRHDLARIKTILREKELEAT